MDKREKLQQMNGEELLAAYDYYKEHFNPLDMDDDNLELTKAEIIRRLNLAR